MGPGSCADIGTKRSLENEGPGAGLGLARREEQPGGLCGWQNERGGEGGEGRGQGMLGLGRVARAWTLT